jgi:catechol 2,3-dioxygenase-like lactoylglutathione lyase family enzyme
MRAILIDPEARALTEIDIDDTLEAYYDVLGCELVEAVPLPHVSDVMYVDEEGHMRQVAEQHYFSIDDLSAPIVGKALVVGTADNGDTTEPTIDIDYLEQRVHWLVRIM